MQHTDPFADQKARIERQNEEIARRQAEERQRIHRQNERLMQTRMESYSGNDLRPDLTPTAAAYASLNSQPPTGAIEPARNYMAGVGLWISRVGFEQQLDGEPPYGYAFNNPVTHSDPFGMAPQPIHGHPVGWDPSKPGIPNLPCQSMHPKPICYQCAYDYYFSLGYYAGACAMANYSCGSHVRCDRDPVPKPPIPPPPGRTPCNPGMGAIVGIGGGALLSIPDEFPWGNAISPEGYCEGPCLAVMAAKSHGEISGPLGQWMITTCELFCRTLRRVGCTAFGTWCEARGGKFTKGVCDLFWEESCIEPVDVQ